MWRVTSVGRVLFVIMDAALKRAKDGAERRCQKHWFREGTARLEITMAKESMAVCSRQVGSSGRLIQTGGGWCWFLFFPWAWVAWGDYVVSKAKSRAACDWPGWLMYSTACRVHVEKVQQRKRCG